MSRRRSCRPCFTSVENLEQRRLLALAVATTIAPDEVPGHSYYVSPSGNDNNDGSITNPFQTIARVNALDLQPADGIFFEGGATFSGSLKLTQEDAGTALQPILVRSYGAGRATING